MKYLPDTNVLSRHLRGLDPAMSERLRATVARHELVVSLIVFAELSYGAEKARLAGERRPAERLARLWAGVSPQPLPPETAEHYGRVRAALEKRGEPIGNMDLLLAAHALALGATVITHNTREFARVPGLTVEDWQSADEPKS